MHPKPTDEYSDVFDHFGVLQEDRPAESCYPYAPVFRVIVEGRAAAIKRTTKDGNAAAALVRWTNKLAATGIPVVTPLELAVANPARIGDHRWVAYPWIDGRPYAGTDVEIAAAGKLLGRLHAHGDGPADPQMPLFPWPDHDAASVEEDVVGLRRVLAAHAPELLDVVLSRWEPWLAGFMSDTLPGIRDRDLPCATASMDFRASNLVVTDRGLAFVDSDNAEVVPRILDLAMSALLFHNDVESAPPRLFSAREWSLFYEAYAQHVRLTPVELDAWQTALRYMLLEWGTWVLIDADDWGDWANPHKRAFLRDLALTDDERFSVRSTTT